MVIPTGRTHVVVATLMGALVAYRYGLDPLTIVVCSIGGLFADTDMKRSMLGRFIPMWLFFHPHRRNLLHSLLGAVACSIPWFYVSPEYALMFWLGYVSHLVLDMFNVTGIPLWYPNKRMVSLGRVKSGGFGELLLAIGFYMIVVVLLSL